MAARDVPDRESLIMALMVAQREWEAGDVDGAPSLLEHLVDDMVLPLLRQAAAAAAAAAAGSTVTNQVSGSVTGPVVQTGNVLGELRM